MRRKTLSDLLAFGYSTSLLLVLNLMFLDPAQAGRQNFFSDWVETAHCDGNRTLETCEAWCLPGNDDESSPLNYRVVWNPDANPDLPPDYPQWICQAKSKPLKCPAPYQLKMTVISSGQVDASCEIYCPPGQSWNRQKKKCTAPTNHESCSTNGPNPINFISGKKWRRESVHSSGGEFPVELEYFYNSHSGSEKSLYGNVYAKGNEGVENRNAFTQYGLTNSSILSRFPVQNEKQKEQFKGNLTSFWRHNFEDILEINSDENVVWHHYDGRDLVFEDGRNKVYQQYSLDIVISSDGEKAYRISNTRGGFRQFDSVGRLVRIENALGLSQHIEYFEDSFRIVKISESSGHFLEFTYRSVPVTSIYSTHEFNVDLLDTVSSANGLVVRMLWQESEKPVLRTQYLLSEISYPFTEYESMVEARSFRYEDGLRSFLLTDMYFSSLSFSDGTIEVSALTPYAHFEYDQYGRATLSELAGGVEKVRVAYGESSTAVTNALGKVANYQFEEEDGVRRLKGIAGEASPSCEAANTYFSYDGEATARTNELGQVTHTQRNTRGQITQTTTAMLWTNGVDSELVTTPESQRTITEWVPNTNLVDFREYQHLLEDGSWETYQRVDYTWLNERYIKTETVTDPRVTGVSQVTTYAYTFHDDAQRIFHTVTVDGPRTDVNDTTVTTYNNKGQMLSVVDALGHTATYADYTNFGLAQTITDQNGAVTVLGYDTRERLETITLRHPSGNVEQQRTTRTTYTFDNKLETVTSPGGSVITYEYDDARRLDAIVDKQGNRLEYVLDKAGNIETQTVTDSDQHTTYVLNKRYDELSRLRQVIQNYSQVEEYDYDLANNLDVSENGRDISTDYKRDALSRITDIIDAENNTTQLQYDAQGNVTRVTDARNLATVYDYNGLSQLKTLQSPDTGTATYTYDDAGNMRTMTDNKGMVTTYTHDALNRLTRIAYSNGEAPIVYGYDDTANSNHGIGRLTSITDAQGETRYHYDYAGNVTAKSYRIGSESFSIAYAYDGTGRLKTTTYPGGREVVYHYNAASQLERITAKENSQSEEVTIISDVQYLPFGPVSQYTYGNGLVRTLNYDLDYKLENLSVTGLSPIMDLSYNYDLNNNIKDITDNQSQIAKLFTYDFLDRLDTASGNFGELDYDYDSVGNRTYRSHTQNNQVREETYTTKLTSNQLDNILIDDNGAVSTRTFDYDDNGNMVSDAQPARDVIVEYNAAERPVVWNINGNSIASTYNALGQRTQKTVNGVAEFYHYNEAGQLLAVSNGQTLKAEYIYFGGEVVAVFQNTDAENPSQQVNLAKKEDQLTPRKESI